MDRKIGIFSVLVVVFIFGIYGTAWAGDGGKPELQQRTECNSLPTSTTGEEINGTFVVTPQGNKLYRIGAVLQKKDGATHELNYTDSAEYHDLCWYQQNQNKVLEKHKRDSCDLEVGNIFGLPGIPVVVSININSPEQTCKDPINPRIYGTVRILIVKP